MNTNYLRKIILLAVGILIFPITHRTLLALEEDSQTLYLDPSNRPQEVQSLIKTTFDEISQHKPLWAYNGNTQYQPMNRDDHTLVKNIIKNIPNQKEVFLLDIGAGNCSWATGIVNFLNQQTDLPHDITVHIISLTGEHYANIPVPESNICKVYNLCGFEIENLSERLQERGLNLNNKIDLIISNYCFMHLHDPSGTFVQAYNLLRPQTGLMFLDGFPIYYSHKPDITKDFKEETKEFLLSTQAPFLIWTFVARDDISHRGLYPFMIRRPAQRPCQLPYTYDGLEKSKVNGDWVKGGVTVLKKTTAYNFTEGWDKLKEQGYNLGYPEMINFKASF